MTAPVVLLAVATIAASSNPPGRMYRVGLTRAHTLTVTSEKPFTIVDPERPWRISNAELHSLNPLSPWDGASGTGAPTRTILRGRVLMVDGELTSGPGYGQFVGTTHASQRMALASTPAPEVSASSGRVGR